MFSFFSSNLSIGLEQTGGTIKAASVESGPHPQLSLRLFKISQNPEDVKQLYMNHPIVITALSGREVLVRSLQVPLTKESDIREALPFQTEPLLPFPVDQAILTSQIVSKLPESTELTVLASRKELLAGHIKSWEAVGIEPEKIGSVSSALSEFGVTFLPEVKCCLILHLQPQETTCVLIKEGKLWASFSISEGLNLLTQAKEKEGAFPLPPTEEEWQALAQHGDGHLKEALNRLQKEIIKMGFALGKECKSGTIEGIAVTGSALEWEGLSSFLTQDLNLPLLPCHSSGENSSQELLSYAVPIGLALGSSGKQQESIDFRQQEWSYPHPWRRLKIPVALYFGAIFLLSLAFYFFGQQYLRYEELRLKESYVELLSGMNKSFDSSEKQYAAKTGVSHAMGEPALRIEQMSLNDLNARLSFLNKELQSSPDSFPLFANIPRVIDILAWLTQHPTVISIDENGKKNPKLTIENFSYQMVKRPQHGKKEEKYQVKIEMEFSSPTPKFAREFHDALIAPNDWIDPKGEIKWSSNRGKYKTSFFLKDKTAYPKL